jgi:hypothetical protein
MKLRPWFLAGTVLLAAAILSALFLKRAGAAGASSLAASADGWLAARTYCERRGSSVTLLDRPLDQAPEGGLVLTLPFSGIPMAPELDALRRRLASGETVVFAYPSRENPIDGFVAGALGLELEAVPEATSSVSPWGWYRSAAAEWRLKPEAAFGSEAGEVVVHAPADVPTPPKGAEILYRGGAAATPAVFSYSRGRGRVLVLPADALSNGRLANPGNANLLESVRVALGPRIVFDEYHHGLVAASATPEGSSAASLDLLLVELVLLYLLGVWALGRRFGPAWQEPPEIASSTASFLMGLGALHRKLRHAAEAAVQLIGNAEGYDPGMPIPAGARQSAVEAGEEQLVELARVIARRQRRRKVD